MKKVLVLFSGGIDSTICLALAIKKYKKKNVETIGFYYGQKNEKELLNSKKIIEYYGVPYKQIDISNIFKFSDSSMLKTSNKNIPHISYDEQYKNLKNNEDVSTNVPFRNGVMLSISTAYAISKNISEIYYGIHQEEGIARTLYPDCDEDFNMAMNLATYLGSGKKVKVCAPLSAMLKKEIIKIGFDLKVPYELTWTCYEDGDIACGKCTACKDRIKGFKSNNKIDPLQYKGE